MLWHLRQEAKNLVKKYTSAYLSRLNEKTRLKKDPTKSLSILEKILQDNGQDPMDPARSYIIPSQSYKIAQDLRQNPNQF